MITNEQTAEGELLAAQYPDIPQFLMTLRGQEAVRESFQRLSACEVGAVYLCLKTYELLAGFKCLDNVVRHYRSQLPDLKRLRERVFKDVRLVRALQSRNGHKGSYLGTWDTHLTRVALSICAVVDGISIISGEKPFRAEAWLSAAVLRIEECCGRQNYEDIANICSAISASHGRETKMTAEMIRKRHTRFMAEGTWAPRQASGVWAQLVTSPRIRELSSLIRCVSGCPDTSHRNQPN